MVKKCPFPRSWCTFSLTLLEEKHQRMRVGLGNRFSRSSPCSALSVQDGHSLLCPFFVALGLPPCHPVTRGSRNPSALFCGCFIDLFAKEWL